MKKQETGGWTTSARDNGWRGSKKPQ